MRWFRRAADQDHADAQFIVAANYTRGFGVAKDVAEAVRWYRAAAEQEVAQQGLDKAMVNVLALTEQYPDLKSDAGFRQPQTDLKDIEEIINLARRYYNGTVRQFNTAIAIFPNSLIAGIGAFAPSPFFMEDPAAQQVPKVSFK